MSVSEAHAEIKRLYDEAAAIENRYPNGLTADVHAEDFAEAKRLLGEIDGLEDTLSGLEEADARKRRILDNQQRLSRPAHSHRQPTGTSSDPIDGEVLSSKSVVRQFVESDGYTSILDSGRLNNPATRVELDVKLDGSLLRLLMSKALVYSGSGVGGPLIRADRIAGLDYQYSDTNLLDLIPTGTTSSNSIEYYEQTLSTNNAAWVAEATATTGTSGLKPEGALGWTLRTSPVSTLAEWIPVTNQMLADVPGMDTTIRNQLLIHLERKLQTDILSGDGNAPNIRGILNTPNILTLAAGGNAIDAVYNAMVAVQVTGLGNPSASVFNPVDFATIRLARENAATGTLGQYLMGPPNTVGPTTLWGRPVVLSTAMTIDTAVVADWTAVTLFDREQAAIRVGLANDDFIRNIQRILAELRAALVVFRPLQICKLTGV
jgi:HK97 family phage major capsid protein